MTAIQRRSHRMLLIATGLLLASFILIRFELFGLLRSIRFPLILLFLVLSNLQWWIWVDGQLSSWGGQRRSRRGGTGSDAACTAPRTLEVRTVEAVDPATCREVVETQLRRTCLRVGWSGYVLAMLLPIVMFVFGMPWVVDALYAPVIMWLMAWHLVLSILAMLMVVAASLRFCFRIVARRARRVRFREAHEVDHGRRFILAQAVLSIPVVLTGAAVTRGLNRAGQFRVRRITMRLPRLPDRLRGLTITHLSDLHVGRIFRPDHLPAVVSAANDLKSDLVVVTGDLVDHSNDYLPYACDALEQLEHRYGRHVVIGNHDLIDDPARIISVLGEREPRFYLDSYLPVIIGGEMIQVAGLFWSRCSRPWGSDPGHIKRVEAALAKADPSLFTIALTHHPHAFDALASRGVDLTLAGHTHGGQFMLTPPGMRPQIGVGRVLFRYVWGEYSQGDSALYVNAGIGNWFPCRLNAPAEIVQIQLT